MRVFSRNIRCLLSPLPLCVLFFIALSCVQTSRAEPLIRFQQSGGYAGISKEWHIYADGRVVDASGTGGRVAVADIERLRGEIHASGFFQLAASYIPKHHCCDFFSYVITVHDGARSHTVATVDQAPGAPVALTDIVTGIKNLLATAEK